jgi:hypothetical protein
MSQLCNIKNLSSPEAVTWTISSGMFLRLTPIPTCTGRIAPGQEISHLLCEEMEEAFSKACTIFNISFPFKAAE